MSARVPFPKLPTALGPEWNPLRGWLEWAARKLFGLPNALVATQSWNPGNVANGASTSTTVKVPGARMGDPVSVGFTGQEPGILFTGAVSSDGVVCAVLSNLSVSGGAFNMNRGTLMVVVWRVER